MDKPIPTASNKTSCNDDFKSLLLITNTSYSSFPIDAITVVTNAHHKPIIGVKVSIIA